MTTMMDDNRFKIVKRITPFINTFFTEKWDVEKLIKILYRDDIINNNEEWNERTMLNNALSLHFKRKNDIKPFTKKFLSHVYHNQYQHKLHVTLCVEFVVLLDIIQHLLLDRLLKKALTSCINILHVLSRVIVGIDCDKRDSRTFL